MFALGSAVPNDAARLLLSKIAPVLIHLPEQISIGGRTNAGRIPGRNDELGIVDGAGQCGAAHVDCVQTAGSAAAGSDRARRLHDLLLPADPLAAANRRIAILVLRGTGTAAAGSAPAGAAPSGAAPSGVGEAVSRPVTRPC